MRADLERWKQRSEFFISQQGWLVRIQNKDQDLDSAILYILEALNQGFVAWSKGKTHRT